MKKFTTFLLFVLIATISFAQSNYQDVVYLKNGSIIRGVIIEQIPNTSIKVETTDKSVFVYQMDEIEKLTKEPYVRKTSFKPNGIGLKKGYKGITELGFEIGAGVFGLDRLKVSVINGYQVNPFFSLGLGTGLRYYFDAKAVLIPFFGDFRANFLNHKVSPYISLGAGYSFEATYGFKGAGFLLSPTAGVSFKIKEKSAINFGLGYEMQKLRGYDELLETITSLNTGAVSINIGISY